MKKNEKSDNPPTIGIGMGLLPIFGFMILGCLILAGKKGVEFGIELFKEPIVLTITGIVFWKILEDRIETYEKKGGKKQ